MQKILIIQTAFIGDVVLATALIEKLHTHFPNGKIDFLVRKGNESLLDNNPHLNEVLIWNKKQDKYKNLFQLLKKIRSKKYDKIVNAQRYFATGFLTAFSGAKETIGFDSNPLSFLFSKKIKHELNIKQVRHEVERNNDLIKHFTDNNFTKPRLYPSEADFASIQQYNLQPFLTIAPTSVWFTKEFPSNKWMEFINQVDQQYNIFLLGGKDNQKECDIIKQTATHPNIQILAGQLSFLQSAALMKLATMNFTNDSAPLHFASAVNAPVTAIFCSTVPELGYTPLSDQSFIVETKEILSCRPCGFHGKKACPEKHFKCGNLIETSSLIQILNNC